VYGKRKRLLPKPDPPPDGWVLLQGHWIRAEEIHYYCKSVINEPIDEQPFWRNDPSYNWRKKRGRRS